MADIEQYGMSETKPCEVAPTARPAAVESSTLAEPEGFSKESQSASKAELGKQEHNLPRMPPSIKNVPPPADCRMRDPWDHNPVDLRNMGLSFSIKDGRGKFNVGTIGCYVRLKDSGGAMLADLFGLTCHHVVSQLGDGFKIFRGDDGPEVTHPGQRDHENSRWSFQERIESYRAEIGDIATMESKVEKLDPALPWTKEERLSTRAYLQCEMEKDNKCLRMVDRAGTPTIGSLWARSGHSPFMFEATKTFPSDTNKRKPWLTDWALIKMHQVQCGKNLLPPTDQWPKQHPEEFDVLRTHGAVFSTSDSTADKPLMHAGPSGAAFGFMQPERVLFEKHFKDGRPRLKTFEACITAVDRDKPFANLGDSGSAIVNHQGQFVGLLHGGRSESTYNRRALFTPAEVLFAQIKQMTGHTVIWEPPKLSPIASSPEPDS